MKQLILEVGQKTGHNYYSEGQKINKMNPTIALDIFLETTKWGGGE